MKLFPRLFLILLGSLLAVAIAFAWLSRSWEHERSQADRNIALVRDLGHQAARVYLDGGPIGLSRWLRDSMNAHAYRGFLLDEDGFNLLPRSLPPELIGPAREAVVEGHAVRISRPPYFVMIQPVYAGGERFYWATLQRLTPGQIIEARRHRLLLALGLALGAVLLLSLLITRLASRPLRELQASVAQLGAGDLHARPSSRLLARRDEFGDLARAFAAMGEQIESLVHSHKQMLRDISHELRSPLARLEVALELARTSPDPRACAELDRIGLEAQRLNSLIGEVLTLARLEQGALELARKPLDLPSMLEGIVADADFEARKSGKAVRLTLPDAPDAVKVMADKTWLARAVENVIRNAVCHTPEDTTVEVSLGCDGACARIRIRDHGPGLPEAALTHLFEPFWRGASTAGVADTGSEPGFGLGLAIAREVVQAHRGAIRAMNAENGGLRVEITLPARTSAS